jgi:hypothetical protein
MYCNPYLIISRLCVVDAGVGEEGEEPAVEEGGGQVDRCVVGVVGLDERDKRIRKMK